MSYRKRILGFSIVLSFLIVAVAGLGAQELKQATFAGGCFWCMEKPFDLLEGVVSTTSGYAGGHVANPTYEQVSRGGTGHIEVVQIVYDPNVVSYEELLYVYWRNVNPTDGGGQFCDRGPTYRPAIFFGSNEERRLAERSADLVGEQLAQRIQTEIVPFTNFYPAEEYHQDFYIKNPIRYAWYRNGCGRDRTLDDVWGDEAGGANPVRWLGGTN